MMGRCNFSTKDPTVIEHAKILVNYSCGVKRGDYVGVHVDGTECLPLIREIASEVGRMGAFLVVLLYASSYPVMLQDDSIARAYMISADEQTLETLPKQARSMIESFDVLISIISSSNTQELKDIPAAKLKANAKPTTELFPIMTKKRWNVTLHPTMALAQEARKSYESYCDFVYRAMLRDWAKIAKEMQVLRDKMGSSKRVRIVGSETDISFSLEGRKAVVEDAKVNLPGGEVFTSPVEQSVNGKVYFDLPANYMGQEVRGVRLVYKNGEIVEQSAEVGGPLLEQLLSTDEGARRLGELGIGMNRGIDEPTRNILFDEKMGDTIHMAVGHAYEVAGGTNVSAIHFDMIKSMKESGIIYFDDTPVYKNGKFAWE